MRSRLNHSNEKKSKGPALALLAAALFGISTPLAKLLLDHLEPILLAALLYLGSGVGLTAWLIIRRSLHGPQEADLRRSDFWWLGCAILLLIGLRVTPASSASLLLNLEGVFTAGLAWFTFKENLDRRIALGMAAIVVGGVLLSWSGKPQVGIPWGPILVGGACLAWGIDNNLTRKVSSG